MVSIYYIPVFLITKFIIKIILLTIINSRCIICTRISNTVRTVRRKEGENVSN